MPAKKYPKYIKDMAMRIDETVKNGTFFTKTESPDTHLEKHVADKDDAKVLDRVFKNNGRIKRNEHSNKEQKSINSGFYSLTEACDTIETCVIRKSLDIAQWVNDARDNEKKSFEVTLSPKDNYEPVGFGYIVDREKNTIDEYETQTVRIVLQKDYNKPLGFSLLTAYPDVIREENRIPTGRDLTDIARETDTFKEASPVAKAYIMYQTGRHKPYLVTFKEGYYGNIHDDVMSIHIPFTSKNHEEFKHIVRIKENSVELSTSKKMEVNIAKWIENGKPKEKVIYPGENVEKYRQSGCEISKDKRFVKVDSLYTRQYGTNGKGKSVDLTREEVFNALAKRMPEAATVVSNSCHDIGIKMKSDDENKNADHAVIELDESLSPRETQEDTKGETIDVTE